MKWKRLAIFLLMATGGFHNDPKQQITAAITCESGIPARFASATSPAHPNMIWISGGTFSIFVMILIVPAIVFPGV